MVHQGQETWPLGTHLITDHGAPSAVLEALVNEAIGMTAILSLLFTLLGRLKMLGKGETRSVNSQIMHNVVEEGCKDKSVLPFKCLNIINCQVGHYYHYAMCQAA